MQDIMHNNVVFNKEKFLQHTTINYYKMLSEKAAMQRLCTKVL